MAIRFEWDERKARANLVKHGVSFDEARSVFGDPLSSTVRDPDLTVNEVRYVIIGRTERHRLAVVVHVERNDTIRIVSARPANRRERRAYEEAQDSRS